MTVSNNNEEKHTELLNELCGVKRDSTSIDGTTTWNSPEEINKKKKTTFKDKNEGTVNWLPQKILCEWVGSDDRKHVVIFVGLPSGVANKNTSNIDMSVSEDNSKLCIDIIWPENGTNIDDILQHFPISGGEETTKFGNVMHWNRRYVV